MPFEKIIYFITLVMVTLFGTVNYKKLTAPFKFLVILIGITIISETANTICAKLFHNNLPIAHFVGFYEYIFYMLIFYRIFKNKLVKKIVVVTAFVVPVFAVINAFTFQPYISVYPTNVIFISDILYTILAMLLYREILISDVQISLFKQSIFWYNTALLFFSVTIFFELGILNYFIKVKGNIGILKSFNITVNLLFYWALAYAIYLNTKEKRLVNE
jgi:hypothetical protein